MKKILLIGLLIALGASAPAKFEKQYGANEIKIEKFQDGGSSKTYSMKEENHKYFEVLFPSTKKAEEDFQRMMNWIEKENFQVLDYNNILVTKKITYIAENRIVVMSNTMNQVTQLVLDIDTLEKTDKFEQYLKINDVSGSISLSIINAKLAYKMRDKK